MKILKCSKWIFFYDVDVNFMGLPYKEWLSIMLKFTSSPQP